MGLQRTSQPAVEPVALADVKASLRVDDTAEDAMITSFITVARTRCEELTGRTLVTSSWKLTLDSFAELEEIPRPPLLAVNSITYVDRDGVTQTLDPSAYRVDLTSEPGRVESTSEWPATAEQISAVVVNFTAGYGPAATDVPLTLRQWIILSAGDYYVNRERSSADKVQALPFAEGLLDEAKLWPR